MWSQPLRACSESSLPLIPQGAARTAPPISAEFFRVAADLLSAAIAGVSTEESRRAPAPVNLVLEAFVEGVVVTDHDVVVAAIKCVPRLARGISHAIGVNDTDVEALTVLAVWCVDITDCTDRANRPSISGKLSLVVSLIADRDFDSDGQRRRHRSGLLCQNLSV